MPNTIMHRVKIKFSNDEKKTIINKILDFLKGLKLSASISAVKNIAVKVFTKIKTIDDLNKEIDRLVDLRNKIHLNKNLSGDKRAKILRPVLRKIREKQKQIEDIQSGKEIREVDIKRVIIATIVLIIISYTIIYLLKKHKENKK